MNIAEMLSFEFMRWAVVSALLLGPACALLGVFVTLRGMAFFSDALAHSAVTGVALGFLLRERLGLGADPVIFVLGFSMALATLMAFLFQRGTLSPDTVIAFSFTGSVAFGVVVIAHLQQYRLLDGILFGSIYANGPREIFWQAVLVFLIGGFLFSQMRPFTLATLCPELARAHGLKPSLYNYFFAILIAATVTIALPMLGALLLSSLIVIPAAAAKLVSPSFRSMLLLASLIGLLAPQGGILVSWKMDLPTGPCIVLANVLVLTLCYALRGTLKVLVRSAA